jgi:hypothetical protein
MWGGYTKRAIQQARRILLMCDQILERADAAEAQAAQLRAIAMEIRELRPIVEPLLDGPTSNSPEAVEHYLSRSIGAARQWEDIRHRLMGACAPSTDQVQS